MLRPAQTRPITTFARMGKRALGEVEGVGVSASASAADSGGSETGRKKHSKGGRSVKQVLPRSNGELFEGVRPEYYFEGGLRKVRPYYFEYQTYAKERWIGRSIIDVFLKEFRDRPARYYREAIEGSLITVNRRPCVLEQLIEASDLVGHKLHRHEPPVTDQPVEILHSNGKILIVHKPASVPAHPSGRYRFNTLIEILRHTHGFPHLSIINRLDRLTSGICILATDAQEAERLHQKMEGGDFFKKEYVARVVGVFPEKAECRAPLRVIEHKLGLVSVDPEHGKPSHTIFERVATDGTHSIVRCQPLTGRTHQIRVHLRHLGHPIANDHLYNNAVWAGHGGPPDSAQLAVIARTLLAETIARDAGAHAGGASGVAEEGGDAAPPPADRIADQSTAVLCPECDMHRPDPLPSQMCIFLHSYRYSCEEWSFEAAWPAWTKLPAADSNL